MKEESKTAQDLAEEIKRLADEAIAAMSALRNCHGNSEHYERAKALGLAIECLASLAAPQPAEHTQLSNLECPPDPEAVDRQLKQDEKLLTAEVKIEPDYWSRGHFYEGHRKQLVFSGDLEKIPVGTTFNLIQIDAKEKPL